MGGDGHLPEDHCFEVNIGGAHQGSPGKGGYFSLWTLPPLADADVPEGTYLTDYFFEDGRMELYNRREDMGEEVNLAGQVSQFYDRMYALLRECRELVEARISQPNPCWEN